MKFRGFFVPDWALLLISVIIATVVTNLFSTFAFGYNFFTTDTAKMGVYALIGVVILSFLSIAVMKGETRARIAREGRKRVWTKILKRIRRNRIAAGIIGDFFEVRDPTLPDELPFVLKDLRVELYTLINLMLRHEIFKAKSERARKLVEDVANAETHLSLRVIADPFVINDEMKSFIEGPEIVERNGKWELKGQGTGFARQYFQIYQIMMKLKGDLENTEELARSPPRDKDDALKKFLEAQTEALLKPHFGNDMPQAYSRYESAVRRFAVCNLVRAHRLWFLDMYNMYGEYERGYGFAKLNAKPEYWEYEASDNGVQKSINFETARYIRTERGDATNLEPGTNFLVEVNLYGYSTSDINAIQIERKNLKYIRRYKKEDIVFFHLPAFKTATGWQFPYDVPRFNKLLGLAHNDWAFFLADVEKGIYHPYSRSTADYHIIAKPLGIKIPSYMNFKKAKFKSLLTIEEIAFDREALKEPGEFIYWGRKSYWHDNQQSLRLYPVNPYPTFSVIGLWKFINDVARKRLTDPALAKKYLDYFKMGYQELERTEQTGGQG